MKKSLIALSASALILTAPVFAESTHASDEMVQKAHEGANTAKEKLHQAEHKGEELELKAKHAAKGEHNTTGSKISEGSQKAWHKTKEGTEKGWDATKEGAEKGWDATKKGAEKGWDATKKGAESLKKKVSE